MKKLMSILAMLMFTAATFADSVSHVVAGTSAENILDKPAVIQKLTLANSSGSAVTVKFFDSGTTALTYTVGAYTNKTVTVEDVVTTYTDILGATVNLTNKVIKTTAGVQAATTNNFRTVYSATVPANTTAEYEAVTGIYLNNGLTVTNSATGLTITAEYRKVQ